MIALLCLGCVGEDPGDLDSAGSSATADTSVATETTDATAGTTDATTGTTDTGTDTAGTGTETAGTDTAGTDTAGTDTAGTGPTIDLGVLALLDVNATSATFDQLRHPDDYQGQISAWYFGHAT